ncbi:MAG: uncharacterized protein KVP18_004252 [Porospora cf. gigantea A]|uniref:uncharacterized protein n=1 Tax=Porospora cf. gigantea A TaxID=2853593 RepID=UPI003559403A|nr:MAG: hypothetical protein KVP18_004252 [Porospora cf. gigantea A]
MVQTSPFHKALVGLPELIPSLTTALPGLLASSDRPGALELLYFTLAGRPELLPMCRDLLSPSVIADLCDDLASSDSDPRKVVVWLSLVMLIADQTWLGQWRYATPSLSTLLLLSVLKRCHLALRSLETRFARQTIRLCASIIINSGGGLVDPDRGFAERLASSGSFWLRSTAKSLAAWRTVDWTLLETHVVLTRAILYCCGSLLVSDTNVNVAQCAYCQLRLLSDPLASLQDTIASLRWPKSELAAEIAEIDRLVAGEKTVEPPTAEPPTAGSAASVAACCHLLPLIRGHMNLQALLRPKEHASVHDILAHITRRIQEPAALCVLSQMYSPPLTIGISSDASCHRLPSVALNGSVVVHQSVFSIT